jgi:hypothetical protein
VLRGSIDQKFETSAVKTRLSAFLKVALKLCNFTRRGSGLGQPLEEFLHELQAFYQPDPPPESSSNPGYYFAALGAGFCGSGSYGPALFV